MSNPEEIKRLLAAATPGPWYQNPFTPINVQDRHGLTVCSMAGARASGGDDFQAELEANAELIAKAPTLIAELIEQVERLEKVAEAAEDAAFYLETGFMRCPSCGHQIDGVAREWDATDALRQALKELSK